MEGNQIEKEEEGIELIDESSEKIAPDDLSKVRISTKQSIMGELIDRLRHKEINLQPEYQREDGIWTKGAQSRLIESIIMMLPLPSFYIDGTDYNKWEVIDGVQRLSTIRDFVVKKTLRLEGLEFLLHLNGSNYDELDYAMQRRISALPITMYIIESGTPEEVKFILFRRINTGGLPLSPQEIRNALNQGRPAEFIAKLAKNERFKKATHGLIPSKRMEDRDFVNRFVAFYYDYVRNEISYKTDLGYFMNEGMRALKDESETKLEEIERRFEQAMETAMVIFGDDAFRKRYNETDNKKPINKALFEALSVNFAKLNADEITQLKDLAPEFRKAFIQLMNDKTFDKAISTATGQKQSVLTRFSKIETLIDKVLNPQVEEEYEEEYMEEETYSPIPEQINPPLSVLLDRAANSYKLFVIYQGKEIYCYTAAETFAKTIEAIGVTKVEELKNERNGHFLISNTPNPRGYQETKIKDEQGKYWILQTHFSTQGMADIIRKIARQRDLTDLYVFVNGRIYFQF